MKVLAVSSGGGHWVELLRVVPALEGHTVHFVTVQPDYRRDVGGAHFHLVRDATSWSPGGALILAVQTFLLVVRVRPDVVITTGAGPGYFAVRFGKLLGARTIWIDTLAYVESISRAGQMVRAYADLWLTQWPEVAQPGGPEYAGQVI
jgi:UDP-N-acetylglucosamine:LPS N-acetylglucosamine transferase